MVSPRIAILPLLLLLTSTSAIYALPTAENQLDARDISSLSEEQLKKLDELNVSIPVCMKKCLDAADTHSIPPPMCAITDQTTSESENGPEVKNAYSCVCTDKPYLAESLSCFVKNCGSNTTALDYALSSQYGKCKLYADINYPKPEEFLNDLCLLDDLPKGAVVPTDVSLVKYIWPDYTFAKDFPKKTATTWAPSGTPLASLYPSYTEQAWTCTPTPLADSKSGDRTSTSGSGVPSPTGTSGNGTTKGNTTATTDRGTAAGGKKGLMGLAVVAAAVAGFAIFL